MPEWVLSLVQSGLVAKIAIGILAIEIAVIVAFRNRLPRATIPLLLNAASGLALMLALQAALSTPQSFGWVAIWLSVGFVAHLAYIWNQISTRS